MTIRTLLVDNYDSFTYNLFSLLSEVNGIPPTVVRNDVPWDTLDLASFDNIVISPGPGHPERARDFGISARVISDAQIPVLGVCLGYQGLCHLFGSQVNLAHTPMHGRISQVEHNGTDLFAGIPSPFPVVRYHSLVVEELVDELEATAWTVDGLLMAVRHRDRPLWGVQFHPESISTEYGFELFSNFRDLTVAAAASTFPPLKPDPSSINREQTLDSAHERPARPVENCVAGHHSPYVVDSVRIEREVDSRLAFEAMFAEGPNSFWLDGTAAPDRHERFTILGDCSGPRAEYITYDVNSAMVRVERAGLPDEQIHVPFFDYLDGQLRARAISSGPGLSFNLGYVGYLGYELKAQTGGQRAHVSPTPDAAMVFADRAVVIDHLNGYTYALCLSERQDDLEMKTWLHNAARTLGSIGTARSTATAAPVVTESMWSQAELRHDHDEYLDRIDKSLDKIREGESYEVCLTNMARVAQTIDPLHTFEHLRAISPTPYCAYLQFDGLSVLSASPERFMRVGTDGTVESKPIKGTRPRGITPAKDSALRQDLLDSEKDRAENLMIVDLTRNDLARVCVPGSVHVPRLYGIETYSSVHQLVSTVRGVLAPDVSAVDCVRSAFPGGSMTGAPKLRTLEIIDELEEGPRGVYSGSIGYFSLNGAADLSIVIRTIVATRNEVTFGVGGAITALSDPEEEFEETLVKAATMLRVLGTAQAQSNEIGQ